MSPDQVEILLGPGASIYLGSKALKHLIELTAPISSISILLGSLLNRSPPPKSTPPGHLTSRAFSQLSLSCGIRCFPLLFSGVLSKKSSLTWPVLGPLHGDASALWPPKIQRFVFIYISYLAIRSREVRVPVVAQWQQTQLVSMGMQVQSLASLRGLKIWHLLWAVV